MRYLSPSTSVCTERIEVYDGSTATSTASRSLSVSEKASFCTRAMASRWLRFIFQLPAISGVRAMSCLQCRQAGQLFALEELQAGTAASGDMSERRLVEVQCPHRCGGVAATYDGEPVDVGDGLGEGAGALRERRQLEHAHRAVPEHRVRVGEL